MATNKSPDSSNVLQTNVRVKIEPGTSASSMPSVSLSERVSSIKVEPGLSTTTTQRLPSYRLPRDLTLGGNIKIEKPKKIYTPNFNVQRNKKKDEATSIKVEPVRSKDSDRGRGRGRGDRGRGRGSRNIIQSTGIWSEGIYVEPSVSRRSESFKASSTDAKRYIGKPKLNMNNIVDKEEERKLKNLLEDDFIDDDEDASEKIEPFLLPRAEKGTNSDEKIKKKPATKEETLNIKQEISNEDKKKIPTIPQIIENNSYILIQFPDSLPGLESGKEESGSKQTNDSNTHSESDNKAKTESDKAETENDNKVKAKCYNLKNLKSGFLGKLEILKSGKTRLRLGETSFFVDVSPEQRFKQDLLVAKVDTVSLTGDLINLGSVNNKLLCSPDLGSVLNS